MTNQIVQKQNPSINATSIKELYKVHARLPMFQSNGLKEYPIIKKYFNGKNQTADRSQEKIQPEPKKRNLRLRTYLDEEEIRCRNLPGPGNYDLQFNWHRQEKKNKNITDRMTYVDQIIRRQETDKSPGPGSYQQVDSKNRSKSFSRLNLKKQRQKQRPFYYNQGEYSASQLPAVGQYNLINQPNYDFSHRKENPAQNKKKFRAFSQKRLKNIVHYPDSGTYNPQDCSFFTFQTAKNAKKVKRCFGVGQRFKTLPQGSGLSPDKYGFINKWISKKSKRKQYQKQGLDVISKPHLRVYN